MKIQVFIILLKKKFISKWSIFKDSILYYPIVFSIMVFVGFLVTSRIDQGFGRGFTVELPYFSSLIFAGSADAARSILSTIATGWATILSVAFSVTLITLQLSTTRYTSHLVNKFEEDRINKLTLGWFIATVLYSLLVLKTVRTGQDTGDLFTPIIGVNIAIVMASIGLFIFVIFLNNISSYLKPKILVLRLVDQIICSIKPFEKRDIDEKYLLHIKNEYKITELLQVSEQKNLDNLLKVESKKEEGILRNINWNSLVSSLKNLTKHNEESHILIEFHKSIGETVNQGNILASVYRIKNNTTSNNNNKVQEKLERKEDINNHDGKYSTINNNNNKRYNKKQEKLTDDLEQKIISSININKERDLSKDPFFGIELLRSLAIKSASNNDIDITNSCITGLFRVLLYNLKNQDVFGIPFIISVKDTVKNKKKKEKDIDKNSSSNNNHNNNNNNNKDNNNDENYENEKIEITIKPKEKPITDIILSELSLINNYATKQNNIPIMRHLVSEYISSSKTLLENDKKNKFYLFTDWFSQNLNYSLESFPKEFHNEVFSHPLIEFQKYLLEYYEYVITSFNIYMKNIIKVKK
jgi:uncharacterized membrane protein